MPASNTLLARYALVLIVSMVANPAVAQEHLGPVDNALSKNPYASPAEEKFGRGVVAGDFDGDGISDLAVSESVGSRLHILRGVAFTVGTSHPFSFFPETVTMPSHYWTMVSGDFDGDGRGEIAVSAFGATVGGLASAGQVHVMNLRTDGIWSVQSTIQAGGAYPGAPQANAQLGNSLAAGDFNGDGYTDLAIGIHRQTVGGFADAGAIMVTYGGSSGISAEHARIFDRSSDGLTFAPKAEDFFGSALAAGDFDGDDDDDLAIGILNGTCQDGSTRAGAVVVLNGSASLGISTIGSRIWRPGVQGIAGTCAAGSNFGRSLVSGHFSTVDFEVFTDLAIGAPAASADSNSDGAVHVLYGTDTGLNAANNQRITAPATAGFTRGRSRFGYALASGRLARYCDNNILICNGDSLTVSAPLAIVNGVDAAGAAWVFDSRLFNRLNIEPARPILPLAPLEIGGPHENDQFGNDLAIGDFNDDGSADLAIGVYLHDDGGETNAGAVQVLYQSDFIFLHGFE